MVQSFSRLVFPDESSVVDEKKLASEWREGMQVNEGEQAGEEVRGRKMERGSRAESVTHCLKRLPNPFASISSRTT